MTVVWWIVGVASAEVALAVIVGKYIKGSMGEDQ